MTLASYRYNHSTKEVKTYILIQCGQNLFCTKKKQKAWGRNLIWVDSVIFQFEWKTVSENTFYPTGIHTT